MENNFNNSRSGRIWAGLLVIGIGVLLLAYKLGAGLPRWLFSWPMILISVGAFLGLRHGFRGGVWLIMMVVGGIFLFDFITPAYSIRNYFWPIIIMVVGLVMILKPRSARNCGPDQRWKREGNPLHPGQPASFKRSNEESQFTIHESEKTSNSGPGDYLDSAAVFGGIRKAFFTKDFKGGEATSVFGGHEIDLSKSDINGVVQLELTQIFGGTKLIVPNNWNIKSEVVAFLGGIEDKRHTDAATVDPTKILLLKGTSILGGIDIRSY